VIGLPRAFALNRSFKGTRLVQAITHRGARRGLLLKLADGGRPIGSLPVVVVYASGLDHFVHGLTAGALT